MNESVKESWNIWSDTWYQQYRTDEAISKIIEKPESVFHGTTLSMIKAYLPSPW